MHVDGPVMFGYATIAGAAGTRPAAAHVTATAIVFPATSTTDWYVIAADGDLDGNAVEPGNTHVYRRLVDEPDLRRQRGQ